MLGFFHNIHTGKNIEILFQFCASLRRVNTFTHHTEVEMEETTSIIVAESKELCDDILVEIFSYLSLSDLKNAALVCSQWNNVVGTSAETMTKFKVNISANVNEEDCFQSQRKHQHYEFANIQFDEVKRVLRRFDTGHAKTFAISKCKEAVECEELMKVVLEMANLSTLKLTYMEVNCVNGQNHQSTKLPELKKLSIGAESFDFLPLIEAPNLSEVTVHGLRHEFLDPTKYKLPQLDTLTRFLSSLNGLKKLSFNADFFEFARNGYPKINLQLSTQVFEMITNNLKQLAMFSLDSDYQPAEPALCNKMKPFLPLESFRQSHIGIYRSIDARWLTPGYLALEILGHGCRNNILTQIVVVKEKFLRLITIDESIEENPNRRRINLLHIHFNKIEFECNERKRLYVDLSLENAIEALEPALIMPDLVPSEAKVYKMSEDFVQKLGNLNVTGGVTLMVSMTDRTKLEFTAK